jgi:LysR family transcriptional regulator, low CO2-responsive transcriptional regulator
LTIFQHGKRDLHSPRVDAVAEPFLDNPLVVIAPLTHPPAMRRNIALAALAGHEFVVC